MRIAAYRKCIAKTYIQLINFSRLAEPSLVLIDYINWCRTMKLISKLTNKHQSHNKVFEHIVGVNKDEIVVMLYKSLRNPVWVQCRDRITDEIDETFTR